MPLTVADITRYPLGLSPSKPGRSIARALVLLISTIIAVSCGAPRSVPLTIERTPSTPCRTVRLEAGDAGDTSIVWFAPTDAAQKRSLDSWCSSVGPAILRRGSRPPAATSTLTLVSWNTHVGAGRLTALLQDLRSGALTDGHPVRQFVVLLQEAYREDAALPALAKGFRAARRLAAGEREAVLDVARREDLWLYYTPSMRNGTTPPEAADWRAEDRGNAILSTLPLSDPMALELPIAGQRRVVAIASTEVAGPSGRAERIRLVSAHLDSTVGWRRLWVLGAERHRARQAAALIQALSEAAGRPSLPTIVGADMNTWDGPSEQAYRMMRDVFPETPRPSATITFPGLGGRFDFLFFRTPASWAPAYRVVTAPKYGSDHRPLIGWLTVDVEE